MEAPTLLYNQLQINEMLQGKILIPKLEFLSHLHVFAPNLQTSVKEFCPNLL